MSPHPAHDCLSESWLAVRTAVEPRRIDVMRRTGELIGFRPEGANEHYYPVWQFDDEWQPLPTVQRITRVAREAGLTEDRLYEVLNARMGMASGDRLADALREGREDHVVSAVRSAAA